MAIQVDGSKMDVAEARGWVNTIQGAITNLRRSAGSIASEKERGALLRSADSAEEQVSAVLAQLNGEVGAASHTAAGLKRMFAEAEAV